MSPPVRVCIDARLPDGGGGVQTFILNLARGLAELGDDDLELTFLVFARHHEWLLEALPAGARLAEVPFAGPDASVSAAERLAMRVREMPAVHRVLAPAYRRLRGFDVPEAELRAVPQAPEAFSALAPDVMHFTHQSGFATTVPSIYHPHDLQHLHFPELFDEEVLALRAAHYGPLARQAAVVVVGTSWVKTDVVEKLGVPQEKVHVVPMAPPAWRAEAPAPLPDGVPGGLFALYPAVMWPHKNHLRLVDAIAALRGRGFEQPLVLTGGTGPAAGAVRDRIAQLGVGDLITVLGFVSEGQLRVLQRAAHMTVVPTLFESASFPVWEAFEAGVPVAASTSTSLPQQVGDAGVLFDPLDVDAMADAIQMLATDDALRARLVQRGRQRLAELSWRGSAERYAALYARLAGRNLTERQREVLTAPAPL